MLAERQFNNEDLGGDYFSSGPDDLKGAMNARNIVQFGELGTKFYRMIFLNTEGNEFSPWHAISLHAQNGFLNFVCLNPRNSSSWMEIASEEWFNPFRLYLNKDEDSPATFPEHFPYSSKWNFGILPQTMNTRAQSFSCAEAYPMEVFEIGMSRPRSVGEIYEVKPLAAIPMENELGKISWIIVVVDSEVGDNSSIIDSPCIFNEILEWVHCWKVFSLYGNCKTRKSNANDRIILEKRQDQNILTNLARRGISGLDSNNLKKIQENEMESTLEFIISNAHMEWSHYVNQEDVASFLHTKFPFPKPMTPYLYRKIWLRYVRRPRMYAITPSGSPISSWSSGEYEDAWAKTESLDSPNAINSTKKSSQRGSSRFRCSLKHILGIELKCWGSISPKDRRCSPLAQCPLKINSSRNSSITFSESDLTKLDFPENGEPRLTKSFSAKGFTSPDSHRIFDPLYSESSVSIDSLSSSFSSESSDSGSRFTKVFFHINKKFRQPRRKWPN